MYENFGFTKGHGHTTLVGHAATADAEPVGREGKTPQFVQSSMYMDI